MSLDHQTMIRPQNRLNNDAKLEWFAFGRKKNHGHIFRSSVYMFCWSSLGDAQ